MWRRFSTISVTNFMVYCVLQWLFASQTTIDGIPTTAGGQCTDNEFACANGNCVLQLWTCDGDNDCLDQSDELQCEEYSERECSNSHFECLNGECIPIKWKCDHETDCNDGSDELGCSACPEPMFPCLDKLSCLPSTWRCDGDSDCKDNSDEVGCEISSPIFTCSDGTNIDGRMRCDAMRHCQYGEDEENCTECIGYLCSNSRCIQTNQYCDGESDCENGEDEPISCDPNCMVRNGDCEHICTQHEASVTCYCKEGFTPFNNTHCQDYNECDHMDGICPGHPIRCVNIPGSYQCACPPEYIYDVGKRTCYSKDSISPPIIFSSRINVDYLSSIQLNRTTPLTNGLDYRDIVAVDFDPHEGTIIFSDSDSHRILKHSLASHEEHFIIAEEGVDTVDGLAFDWIYDNLYFTESQQNKIEVICLKTLFRRILFNTDLDEPRGIVVDPVRGYLYFTDWGANPKIEKAAMDGSSRDVIIVDNLYWPNGLCIEYTLRRLYWVNAVPGYDNSYIASSDLNGGRIQILVEGPSRVQQPFAITVLQDKIYWTDWGMQSVLMANSFTGDDWAVVLSNVDSPRDIRVFNTKAKYNADNTCPTDKYACSHICLASPKRSHYSCACPGNTYVAEDGRTCICSDTAVLRQDGVTCGEPQMVTPSDDENPDYIVSDPTPIPSGQIKFKLDMTCNLHNRLLKCRKRDRVGIENIPDDTPISISCRLFKTTGELICAY